MKQISRWTVVFGVVFSVAASGWAALSCDVCQEAINGNYMEYKAAHGHFEVCMDCVNTHPKCAACKVPHKKSSMTQHQGEWLCQSCLQNAKFCSFCRQRIEGQYFSIDQGKEFYCSYCYLAHPKCKVCGRPKPKGHIDSHSGACRECLASLEKCSACGEAITGRYYEFEHKEGQYCEDCKLHREACYVCGAPVGLKYWKYPDGRFACLECNARAVLDVDEIHQITQEVEGLLRQQLNLTIQQPYELEVQALNKTSVREAEKAKEGESSSSPLYGRELGLYRKKDGQSTIFLLYGLPREIIYETAAHELAHAWQAENVPPNQSDELREGFAQWVGAQILKIKGFPNALKRLESRRDHPYGTGYHRLKTVANNLGHEGILVYVKKQVR